jgi:hypothetical protein
MQTKLFIKFGLLLCISLFISNTLLAQGKKPAPKPLTDEELQKLDKGKKRPPTTGAAFQISPIESVKGVCHALLVDGENRTFEDFIPLDKLPLLEAIITEARKFGLTEESVGTTKPVTTRFSDKQVPNFVVDVSKQGKQTHFYVTMQSKVGKITVDAGVIKRGDPNATAFLYEMLAKIEHARTVNPIQ